MMFVALVATGVVQADSGAFTRSKVAEGAFPLPKGDDVSLVVFGDEARWKASDSRQAVEDTNLLDPDLVPPSNR
jgi:hypothetical protein